MGILAGTGCGHLVSISRDEFLLSLYVGNFYNMRHIKITGLYAVVVLTGYFVRIVV